MNNEATNNPVDIAKSYVDANFPGMSDGSYYAREHNPQHDMHLSGVLDAVEDHHFDEDPYHVVTVSKEIQLEGGVTIPHTMKITVKNDQVSGVLTSK